MARFLLFSGFCMGRTQKESWARNWEALRMRAAGMTLGQIGSALGRDHSSVSHMLALARYAAMNPGMYADVLPREGLSLPGKTRKAYHAKVAYEYRGFRIFRTGDGWRVEDGPVRNRLWKCRVEVDNIIRRFNNAVQGK